MSQKKIQKWSNPKMLFSEHIRKVLQSKVFKMLVKGAKNWYLYPLLALLSLSKHYLELNSMRFELTFRQNIINARAAISLFYLFRYLKIDIWPKKITKSIVAKDTVCKIKNFFFKEWYLSPFSAFAFFRLSSYTLT